MADRLPNGMVEKGAIMNRAYIEEDGYMRVFKGFTSIHERKPLTFISQLPQKQQRTIRHELVKYYADYDLPIEDIDDIMNETIANMVGISSDYEELNKVDYILQIYGGYPITAIYDNDDFQYTMYNFGR